MVIGYNVRTLHEKEQQPTTLPQTTQTNNHIWPMYKNNAQCTGYTFYNTSHNKGGEKWKYFIEDSIHGTATIDKNGIIYVATPFDGLHAVYPNGTRKWRVDLEYREFQAPAIAPDGTIYVATMKWFYAFYPNGTLKWISDIEGNFFCELAVDSNGTVYAGTQEGYVYAIYSNGTLKWKYYVEDFVFHIALDKNENIYFYGVYKNKLFCLSQNGTLKWGYKEVNVNYGPLIEDDGTIYIASSDLIALYPNGTEKWKVFMHKWAGSPSLAPDGTIIVSAISYDEYITAVNPTDGSIIWQYLIPIGPNYLMKSDAAIDSNGTIYLAYSLREEIGYLCALTSDGTLKWETHLSSDIQPYTHCCIFSQPSISSDGTIYITTDFNMAEIPYSPYGYLYAIGKQNPIEAPDAPIIIGETNGLVGWNYEYTFQASSPSGDDVYYFVDWGDYDFERWFGPYPSGFKIKLTHIWHEEGTYNIMVRAKTGDGLCSPWSKLKVNMQYDSNAPSAPTITGQTNGFPGIWYRYKFKSTSPLNRDVYYYIEWGDGSKKDWIGPFNSGKEVTVGHSWSYPSYYYIRARAKDSENLWGPWAELEVLMPRDKAISNSPLLRFLERYPLLNRLLNILVKLG